MPARRNHHFVPQFYLRTFAGGHRFIAVFNLRSGAAIREVSIKGQCQRPWLYGGDGRVEQLLGTIEQVASSVIAQSLRSMTLPDPSTENHQNLLGFLLFQWARTPQAAATRAAMDGAILNECLSSSGHAVSAVFTEDPIRTIATVAPCLPLLMDLRTRLIQNESATEFVTSDGPVSVANTWANTPGGPSAIGFANHGIQVVLPLTPRVLLFAYDSTIYRLPGHSHRPLKLHDDESVAELNKLQLLSVHQNLYFSGDHKTEDQILKLPLHLRLEPKEQLEMRATDAFGARKITLSYRPPAISVRLPFASARDHARRVPRSARPKHHRQAALRSYADWRPWFNAKVR